MTIKEMRKQTGFTQKEFAEYFNLSKRTVESWEGGTRKCFPPMLDLIEYKLSKEGLFMKKFNVAIRIDMNDDWDYDAINDYVYANNPEEALDFAKDHLRDSIIQNCNYDDVDEEIEKMENEYQYRIDELDDKSGETINSIIY